MASSRRPPLPTDPGGGGMRGKMTADRSWIWGNGSVVCDKWMRHGKCSREGCTAEHRLPRVGERVPVCYDYIVNKDGCTYRGCPLEHRERGARPEADVASGRKGLPPVPTGFKLGNRPEPTAAKGTDTKVNGGRDLSRVDKGKGKEVASPSLSLGTGIDRLVTGSPDMQSGGAALWDYRSRSPSPVTQSNKLNGATTSLLLPPRPVQAQNKVTPARFVNSKTSPEVLARIREVGTGAPPQPLDLTTMEVRRASSKQVKTTYTTRTIRQKEGPVVVSDAKPKDGGVAVNGNSQLEKSQARKLSPTTARNTAKSLAEQYKHHGKSDTKEYSVPMEANPPALFVKQLETIDSVHRRSNSQDSASSGHSSSIIAAAGVLIPEQIAAVLAKPKPKVEEEYVEPPYRWQQNARPHWDVLRCFNCWGTDHQTAIFCQFGPRSLEQKERLRVKRGIVNRRFTEMMLLARNVHVLQRVGTYDQHVEYLKMWADAKTMAKKDGLPVSVQKPMDNREPGTVAHPVDIWTPLNPPVVTPRRPSPDDDFCMPGPQPPKDISQSPQAVPLPQTASLPSTVPKQPAAIPPHLKRVYAQQDCSAMSAQSQVPVSSQSGPAAPKELTVAPKQPSAITEEPTACPKKISAADIKRPAVTNARSVVPSQAQYRGSPARRTAPPPEVQQPVSGKEPITTRAKPQRSPSPEVRIVTPAKTQQKVAPKSKTPMKPSTNGSAGSTGSCGSSGSEGKNGCWHCAMDDHTFSEECLRRKITPGSIESVRQTAPPALTRKAIIASVIAPPKPQPKAPRKPSPKDEPRSEVWKGKQPERRIQSLEPDEIKDPSLAIVRSTGWIQGKALAKKKPITTSPHHQQLEPSANCWGSFIDFDFDPMSPRLIRSEEDRKKPLPQKYSELGVKPTTTAVRIFDRNVYLHRREELQTLRLLQRNEGIAADCREDQWRFQEIPAHPSRCAKIPLMDAVMMPAPIAHLAKLPAELLEMILLDLAGDDPNLMSSAKIRTGSNFNPANFETRKRYRNLRALMGTCKSLKAVVQEIVYRYVGLTKYSAIVNFVKAINEYPHLAHHVQAVKLQVVKTSVQDPKEKMHRDVIASMMIVLIEKCAELQVLSVEMPHALYGFGAITGQFPNMREIQIKDWGSPGMVLPRMWSNLGLFENLVKFKIIHSDENDYRDFTPLELPGHRMSLTIQRLPKKLKTLIMENAPELSDRYLEVICTHCPDLETLYVVNCKLVTTVGFTKGIKLMGKKLRQMTFYLWQNANGQPLQVDKNASDADNYEHHLCAVIRDAAPHIEKCCLRVFRCCDALWDDVVFEKMKVFQLGMYQYRHCHQTRHVPEDEEKFENKIKDALRAGRFPERRVLGAMLRRPGLSFQASDN